MKSSLVSKLVLASLALLIATSAFAAESHKATVQFLDPVQINGKKVPAGDYQVKWEGNGPSVDVTISQGKKVLATSSAKLVDLDSKSLTDAALVKNNPDGSRALTEIRFSGKKFALNLEGADQAKMSSDDATK